MQSVENKIEKFVEFLNKKFGKNWRDLVLASGGFVFSISLLPTVFSGDKPPILSSLPTWFFLWVFAFAYATNKEYKGAFWTFICGSIWLIILLQKLFF